MRLSALGYIIIIHPAFVSEKWYVIIADKNGNFIGGSLHDSKKEASLKRSRLFRLHRKLKKKGFFEETL